MMYARHLGANLAIVRKQTHDDRPDRLHECSSFLFDLMSSVYIIRGMIHVCGIKCCFWHVNIQMSILGNTAQKNDPKTVGVV